MLESAISCKRNGKVSLSKTESSVDHRKEFKRSLEFNQIRKVLNWANNRFSTASMSSTILT